MNCMLFAMQMPEWANFLLQVVIAPFAVLVLVAWLARIAIWHRYVMMLIGLFLLVVGCALYFENGVLLAPLCNAVLPFFFESLSFDASSQPGLPHCFFHIIGMVYALSILLAVFGIGLVNRLIVVCRGLLRRPMNVFWDYSEEARCLAESMGTVGRSSVVFALRETRTSWMKMQDDEAVHVLSRMGWKWV